VNAAERIPYIARLRARIAALEAELAVMTQFKEDVCRRSSTDQHGWSEWVAKWGREKGSAA